ncbi:LuxR C-terminal-related transcriptional regulator [Streptomyces sp. NPDC055607]
MGAANTLKKWPLEGRNAELAALLSALADRHSRGVVLAGPAGAGKTRLAEECLARMSAQGFSVGQATASAAAGSVPLGAIAHLLPEGVDLSDPVGGFAAVAAVLRRAGSRWVLMVDDLHLLDATSAVLLRQLMDVGAVKLLATVRTGEPIGESVQTLMQGDSVHRTDMGAFDLTQTEEVLEGALGAPVGRHTLSELFNASGGNALYLRELVLGAVGSGSLRNDGEVWELVGEGRLPTTRRLVELIRSRLERMGHEYRSVLDRLAVSSPQSVTELSLSVPPETIDRLETAGLIEVLEDRRRVSVRLAHPLYGEVLRAEMPTVRRRALLAAEAERIAQHGTRRRGDALRVAICQLAATGTADPELLLQAANLARHSHDYPQVVTLLKALPEEHTTVGTRVLLGDAYYQMGQWSDSERVLSEASALADEDEAILSVVMTRVDNLLWSKAPLSAALTANTEALHKVTSEAARHMLHINEGYILVSKGHSEEGLKRLEGLEEDIEQVQDINPWLRGALMKAFGLSLVARTEQGAVWAERAYHAHMAVDEHALVSHPAVQKLPWVLALCEGGRLSASIGEGKTAYDQLSAYSSVVRVWLVVLIARAEWLAGHAATSRRWYGEAIALARKIDNTMTLRHALSGLAACAAVQGDIAAAEDAVEELQTLPNVLGFLSEGELRIGPAWLAAARGDLARARELLGEGAALAEGTGHLTGESLLLADIARLGAPGEVAGRLAELAGQGDGGTFLSARAEFAASLATADAQGLRSAALRMEEVGADLMAAEACAAAAHALRRAGLPRAAADSDNRSAVLLNRCEGARTPLMATSASPSPLTDREREIAIAAASGTTSKDIAASLTLSVRTVNNHLQRIYTKLGVGNRRELAAALGVRSPS